MRIECDQWAKYWAIWKESGVLLGPGSPREDGNTPTGPTTCSVRTSTQPGTGVRGCGTPHSAYIVTQRCPGAEAVTLSLTLNDLVKHLPALVTMAMPTV